VHVFFLCREVLRPQCWYSSHLGNTKALSHLTGSLLSAGRSDTFTINCSGFDRHGVDPAVFQTIFSQKDFRPVINYSIPTRVNISFTVSAILDVIWTNPFISWDPEKCGAISKLAVTTENLWLPDIFIVESWVPGLRNTEAEILQQVAGQDSNICLSPLLSLSTDVDQTPEGLSAYLTNDGHIVYNKPMRVTSICNLDIFYFPFDQQNCTLTFSSFLYTVENMLLGMEKEVWEIADTSRDIVRTQGEWELLGINKATPKMSVGSSLFDQIMFYVAIRRRPSLYVINLLVPSSFLISIDALSFYLPAESENRAPFKITLLLGYNVFLLMMNKLLPASGTPLISVYFALCLSLMVVSLLETIFITYLLHMATTQPPPMPRWLYSLLLHCTTPLKSCPTALQKENTGPGLMPTHLPGLKEPGQLVGKELGSREAELNGDSGLTSTQLADLWVQFSHMMDTFLFRLYLFFLASSIITVIILWNT
ncbi:5HT3C protein, partial [Crocuta crocuta]